MPELPEVETVVRGLAQHIIGQEVQAVDCSNATFRGIPSAIDGCEIESAQIQSVVRRAKYIIINFSNKKCLIVHLGMSGKLLYSTNPEPKKHDHLRIEFLGGNTLVFNDPRRFGLIKLLDQHSLAEDEHIANLGIEPFSKEFTTDVFFDLLQKSARPIKIFLMDGSIVVGVGNIYASEALFMAGISPTRPANSLTKSEAASLHAAVIEVLRAAINSGGSTLRDYVRSNGDVGGFQHSFKVYDKANEPCSSCNSPIQKIVQTGRSTYFCKKCQK